MSFLCIQGQPKHVQEKRAIICGHSIYANTLDALWATFRCLVFTSRALMVEFVFSHLIRFLDPAEQSESSPRQSIQLGG